MEKQKYGQMWVTAGQDSVFNRHPEIKDVKSRCTALFDKVKNGLSLIFTSDKHFRTRQWKRWMSAVSAPHQFSPLMSCLDAELSSCHRGLNINGINGSNASLCCLPLCSVSIVGCHDGGGGGGAASGLNSPTQTAWQSAGVVASSGRRGAFRRRHGSRAPSEARINTLASPRSNRRTDWWASCQTAFTYKARGDGWQPSSVA